MKIDESCFSFTYGGKSSREFLPTWKRKQSSRRLDENRTRHTTTWTDPATYLEVRCQAVEYRDFQASEWTLFFKNTGSEPTPILENIQAIDRIFQRPPEGEFVLHSNSGDKNTADSFQPFALTLEAKALHQFAPVGGRPTNHAFSYYNVQMAGGGVLLAIGWPGQWASCFERDADRGLRITAGQELVHLSLKPGESIRSPLIALVFWQGDDTIVAQNVWRRWMLKHNLPRTSDGQLPATQIVACSSHQFLEMKLANEENQLLFVDRYVEEGMNLDYWWMDAGWYPCKGDWPRTGTWEVDRTRFPRGFRPISDRAHAAQMKIIVWFEPERVGDDETWLKKKHPEWVLTDTPAGTPIWPGGVYGSGFGGLLNLGNPKALKWLINHIDRFIKKEGIDLYRQDFNTDPLPFWRAADAPDRQGLTENLYVCGYLTYWDALRKRHPGLRIDSCAQGGRRNDLETLRRAVPHVRSDYIFEPTSQQNHHYSYSSWIPYHGGGYIADCPIFGAGEVTPLSAYGFRSNMSPSLILCYDVRKKDMNYEAARLFFKQLRDIGPNYLGDFYPLTPYNLANDVWMAWQYDRPGKEGIVQVFRRADSGVTSQHLKLRGLDPATRYQVTDLDHPDRVRNKTGAELMEKGLLVTIEEQPGARVFIYRPMTSTD